MRKLPTKHAAALAVTLLLGGATVGAGLVGSGSIAIALLGMAVTLALAVAIDIHRKVGVVQRNQRHLRGQLQAVRQAQRHQSTRVHGLMQQQRTDQRDHHRQLLQAVSSGRRETASSIRAIRQSNKRISTSQRRQAADVEALLQLYRDLTPRAPMPSSGDWALHPTGLLDLLFLIEQTQPKLVLELGSGTSTIWIGYKLEKLGGKLISLDHEASYSAYTTSLIALHQLADVAEVRHAPLKQVQLGDETFHWYDLGVLPEVQCIDLLIVDGPPGATGPMARYPAVPLLESRLAEKATVVLDDAARPDEAECVRRWLRDTEHLSRESSVLGEHATLRFKRKPTT